MFDQIDVEQSSAALWITVAINWSRKGYKEELNNVKMGISAKRNGNVTHAKLFIKPLCALANLAICEQISVEYSPYYIP